MRPVRALANSVRIPSLNPPREKYATNVFKDSTLKWINVLRTPSVPYQNISSTSRIRLDSLNPSARRLRSAV